MRPTLLTLTLILGFASSSTAGITFDDVLPLLQTHCQGCHSPGQIAPMSLRTYEETRPWAESIKENVSSRTMPPWHATSHPGEFQNDRSLSQAEIDTIVGWVEAGAPRGTNAEAAPSSELEGWAIGKPDLVLSMAEDYEVSPQGTDQYIYFALPTNLPEDRWVTSVEIRPGNNAVVHHVLAFVQPGGTGVFTRSGEGKNKDLEFPLYFTEGQAIRVLPDAPVYDDSCVLPKGGLANDGDMTSLLSTFVPGYRGDVYAKDLGKLVPKGSEILFQIHYTHTGKVEHDRTSIALRFAETPPPKSIESYWVQNRYFRIPPGAAAHEVKSCYVFDKDVDVLSYFPHMHVRGKGMKIEAFYPGGEREILLDVPRYDFNWQTTYWLRSPKRLPAGTQVVVTAHFDNSRYNRSNPDPKAAVRWGDPTTDEMMIGGFDYVAVGATTNE